MIVLQEFTKYFHRNSINEVLALDRISLELRQGDFVTVIGSNGAGKSTLLNGVAGTFFPDAGRLMLGDTDITRWPEHRRAGRIGRVFQDPMLGTCGALSIEQNMALASRRGKRRGLGMGVRSGSRDGFRAQLQKLALGLEHRLRDKVGLLSGGQRQALTMLMATMVRPEILLLDEHTAALDPGTARQILSLTRRIVEERSLTTLMVTHNMNQALELGNRLIMVHRGRVILDVRDEEKQRLTVDDLLARFYEVQGEAFSSDRMLLA
ncbi:ABC transporter ATP-binding protein [Desulfonema ishimotonii]|uniref:ABC transporter ATP-binding protein n=1 Tax=Desulfonema ishimotonii TaxID=45657 RepID=A0A401FWU9_9BACT|nr:ATP-binding cassette domain-containing protein [Desulfonema ishimotonii]GBC61419.1 ABC transporter ATP-binding protein [Desulfonema ishimotonii]